MRTFLLINFFILIFNNCYSQYEDESYDDITSEKTYFTIGYLNTHMDFPSRFNNKTESQNGFLVGSRFNRRTLEDIDIGKFAKARFNIGGEFSLGITLAATH